MPYIQYIVQHHTKVTKCQPFRCLIVVTVHYSTLKTVNCESMMSNVLTLFCTVSTYLTFVKRYDIIARN